MPGKGQQGRAWLARGLARQKHGGIKEQGGFGEYLQALFDWSDGLTRRVMGTHTQNSFTGDFLTFFDAGTTIRFLGIPSCALSIKDPTGVPTLIEENNFFNRANPGARVDRREPHPCNWPDHLTQPWAQWVTDVNSASVSCFFEYIQHMSSRW